MVKALFDIASACGFSSIEINPVFKLVITKGDSGIQVYDFYGNNIPFEVSREHAVLQELVFEYPTIKADRSYDDETGFLRAEKVEFKYEDGKLKEIDSVAYW